MTALIDFLLKIFARLVWGSEEEWYRRKKLREMLKTLREHHSDWIDSSGRRLEPGLASSLLNLARNVKMTAALVPVLASLNSDTGESYRAAGKLILDWLDEESVESILSLDYEVQKKHVFTSKNSLGALGVMEKRYGEVSEILESELFEDFSKGFFHLLLLSELLNYDFQSLLNQFDPSFSINNPRYISAFAPVSAAQPVEELLDFYYIWQQFDVSAALEKMIWLLGSEDDSEEEKKGKQITDPEQIVFHLRNYVIKNIPAEDFLLLLRIIKDDPDFEPVIHPVGEDPHRRFITELRKRYEAIRIRLEREILEKKIQNRIVNLFSGNTVKPIACYNDLLGGEIFNRGLIGFIHTLPLTLISNYLEQLYMETVPAEIGKVLRDGFFPDPGFSRALERLLVEGEQLIKSLKDFEDKAASMAVDDRFLGTEEILAMLRSKVLSSEDKTAVEQYSEHLNREARKMVDTGGRLFGELQRRLESIVADSRDREPRVVTNIRTLSGEHVKTSIEALKVIKAQLDQLMEILKEYTVTVDPAALRGKEA
jgi:hypothetical protein